VPVVADTVPVVADAAKAGAIMAPAVSAPAQATARNLRKFQFINAHLNAGLEENPQKNINSQIFLTANVF
jgi:hypothetical protein